MSKARLPWVRFLAEGTAIVLSILVAFAIDASWDRAQQRAHLDEVLQRLEAGLEESLPLVDINIENVEDDLSDLRWFILLDPQATPDTQLDSVFGVLQTFWRPNTSDNNVTLLLSLVEDETLKLLDDRELQEAIVRWREVVGEVAERNQQMAVAEREALRVVGRDGEVARIIAAFRAEEEPPTGGDAALLRRLRVDEEVLGIVARKALQAEVQRRWLQSLRQRSEVLLTFVRLARGA